MAVLALVLVTAAGCAKVPAGVDKDLVDEWAMMGDTWPEAWDRFNNMQVVSDPIGTVLFPLLALVAGVPLIGWAKPVPVNVRRLRHQRRDYVLVAAAGPASNLVLAVLAAIALRLLPVSPVTLGEPNLSAPMASLLSRALTINVLLAVFNMIPIPPLDGGNVLAGLLPYSLATVFNRLRPYGFLLLYALLFSGGFDYLVMPPYRLIVSWLPTQ